MTGERKQKKYDRNRPQKPLDARGFYDAAIRYLERYSSTADNLRRVLDRRAKRWEIRSGQKAPADIAAWIDAAVASCVASGFVNDDRFVEQKIISLRRQGRSARYIQQALMQKGASARLVADMLAAADADTSADDDADLIAARRMVQRKRMVNDDRNLARLMRAGFSMKTARAALRTTENE